jgi:rhomboid protease GluP
MNSAPKNSRVFMPTYILIAINVLVFAYTSYLSGNIVETSDKAMSLFWQDNYAILNGEVWRFLTAMFVHANIVHIFGNMFILLIFGLRAENMFDVKEYLSIYLLSGLTGGFLTFFLLPDSVSVGASGAIFGLLGATIIYVRRSIGQSIITALLYAFFLFMINLGPDVNIYAHLGGLVTGLLLGYALASSRKPRQRYTYGYTYSYSA